MTYHIQEAVFQIPDQFHDKTVNVFTLSDVGASEFSVIVSRDILKDDWTLFRYTERQIIELEQKLPNFKLLKREETSVDSISGFRIEIAWHSQGKKMYQRQVVLELAPPVVRARQALIFTASIPKEKLPAEWESLFNQVISSIRIRRP